MKPENPRRYREDRPRPTMDLCGSFGNLALTHYELTEHDAQFSSYDGHPVVQADIVTSGYAHDLENG